MADSTRLSLILGARNGATEEREENDFYATDPNALRIFLDKFTADGESLNHNVWEVSCGDGGLSHVLEERGHSVFSTDLIDRGYEHFDKQFDYLSANVPFDGDVLTNPPFSLAKDFVLQSLKNISDGNKVFMFLKIQFLEGIQRLKDIYSTFPPKFIYVHSSRQKCAKKAMFDRCSSPTLCYCWFVWEKGFNGEPILRWIP